MPRFVILEHDHPHRHWDLMLEAGDALKTWRLAHPPTPDHPVRAEPTFNHRLMYLDYEGPISGDRGHVTRWDHGIFFGVIPSEGNVTVELRGNKLSGTLRLEYRGEGWEVTISG